MVSRCSVKMSSFRRDPSGPNMACSVESSPESWTHLASTPWPRSRRASSSSFSSVRISNSSSAMVAAAVAASTTSTFELLLLFAVEVVPGIEVEATVVLEVVGEQRRQPLLLRGHSQRSGAGVLALFNDPVLEPLPASSERLVDRFGRGGEPALQHGEREADGVAAATLALGGEPIGSVHLLADVLGDLVVEGHLVVGQLVLDGGGSPLREERLALEGEQTLLDHATHEVARVDGVDAVAEPAFEAVAVEQRKEELEVLLLAGMRRGGHQQEVAGGGAEDLAELVLLGLLDLGTEEVGRHAVGLVDDDQVPVGLLEPFDQVFAAGDLVDPADEPIPFVEDIAGVGAVEQVLGDDVEAEPELVVELVLPLGDEAAGGDDEDALGVAPDHQLLDVEPGHDRLAGARVVGEEEAQRLAGQHLAVDGLDLVRERVDLAGGEGEVRVEEVREVDPAGLGGEAEQVAVTVEAPGPRGALVDAEACPHRTGTGAARGAGSPRPGR